MEHLDFSYTVDGSASGTRVLSISTKAQHTCTLPLNTSTSESIYPMECLYIYQKTDKCM